MNVHCYIVTTDLSIHETRHGAVGWAGILDRMFDGGEYPFKVIPVTDENRESIGAVLGAEEDLFSAPRESPA